MHALGVPLHTLPDVPFDFFITIVFVAVLPRAFIILLQSAISHALTRSFELGSLLLHEELHLLMLELLYIGLRLSRVVAVSRH